MNKLYTLLLPLFFTACSPYRYIDGTSQKKSITDIPLKPGGEEVAIFFDGDRPREPFYKVRLVEADVYPGSSSEATLTELKRNAQGLGLDGLLINDPAPQPGNTVVTTYRYASTVVQTSKMVAIGIKYRRTINYMDTILRAQVVSWWDKDTAAPKQFTMQYDFYGNNLSLKDGVIDRFYNDEFYPFQDMRSPYAAVSTWQYTWDPDLQVYSKRLLFLESVQKKCNFYYNGNRLQRAEFIFSPPEGMGKKRYRLEPQYDAAGLLVGRSLLKKDVPVWKEDITYRFNGTPDKIRRYTFSNGRPVLLFEIKNEYYSEADLPAPEH